MPPALSSIMEIVRNNREIRRCSQEVKAHDFDSCTRWFESNHRCQRKWVATIGSLHAGVGGNVSREGGTYSLFVGAKRRMVASQPPATIPASAVLYKCRIERVMPMNIQYVCGYCGTVHDSALSRALCEWVCHRRGLALLSFGKIHQSQNQE